MYIYHTPARLDYAKVSIVRSLFTDAESGLPVGLTAEDNFVKFYRKRNVPFATMVIQEHKTADSNGVIENELPRKVVDLMLQLPVTQSYMFESRNNKHFKNASCFGNYLKTTFKKLCDKELSCDMLRHIYVSHYAKYDRTLKVKAKMAKAMGHSVGMNELYRRVD
jgi:hypothetical protein